MTIPIKYRKQQETSIATYNYTDIASGVGYVTFYLIKPTGTSTISGATLLTSASAYDPNVATETTTNVQANVWTLLTTTAFDTPIFALPRTMEGDAVYYMTNGVYDGQAGVRSEQVVIPTLQKVDSAGTVTNIVVGISGDAVSDTGSSAQFVWQKNAQVLTIPKTHFKKGDVLRLKIEQWYKRNSTSGDGHFAIAHDPKNATALPDDRTMDGFPSISTIDIPFDIDL